MRSRNFEKVEKVCCKNIKITNVNTYCNNYVQKSILISLYKFIYLININEIHSFIYTHLIIISYIIVGVQAWEMIFSGFNIYFFSFSSIICHNYLPISAYIFQRIKHFIIFLLCAIILFVCCQVSHC